MIRLLYLLIIIFTYNNAAWAQYCISAADFGMGVSVSIPADGLDDVFGNLLVSDPENAQVAAWVDSGVDVDNIDVNTESLKGYVYGEWYPLGLKKNERTELDKVQKCQVSDCISNIDNNCLDGGIVLSTKRIIMEDGSTTSSCKENDGYALYGLIAMRDAKGIAADPNAYPQNLPSNLFRTFRVGPIKKLDATVGYFELNKTSFFAKSANGNLQYKDDVLSSGNVGVQPGRLYFKIMDNTYKDNKGSYDVTIVRGYKTSRGFISELLSYFKEIMGSVQKVIFAQVVQDKGILQIVRVILVLYTAIGGLIFMSGLVKNTHGELIIRLLKVGFIATIFSPSGMQFFFDYIYGFFINLATSVSDSIIIETIYSDRGYSDIGSEIPKGEPAMTVYDTILNILISRALHIKTWALLFTAKIYFIPVIYFCIVMMLMAVIKGVLIYLLALINIALLVIIAPIFMVLILFSLTKSFFDDWLKQLVSSAMMFIFLASTMALMYTLVIGMIQKILFYRVCWASILPWDRMDATTVLILRTINFDIKFWTITNAAQVLAALDPYNLFALILLALFFYAFLEQIPTIVDTLSASFRGPMTSLYRGATGQWEGSFISKGIDKILAEPQARIGAGYEYGVNRLEDIITNKISKGKGGAMGFAGGKVAGFLTKVLRAPVLPSTVYRQLEGFGYGVTQPTPQSLLDDGPGGETKSFVNLSKLKFKPKPKSLPEIGNFIPKSEQDDTKE